MKCAAVLALCTLAFVAREAHAQSVGGSVPVGVTVPGRCAIDVVTGVSFGTVTVPLAANRDAAGSVHVQCNFNTSVTLTLGPGQNHNGATRRMAMTIFGVPHFLDYNLYQNAARTTLWGSDTKSVPRVPGRTWQVFARIPAGAGATAGPGIHSDVVVITAAW